MVQDQEQMGEDEAVNKEMDDSLVRVVTTASSLEAEQDIDNIFKTQSKATLNEPGSQGTSSVGIPSCQETIGDTTAQTRAEYFEDEGLGEEDASKQGRIADVDANEDICLVNVYNDEDMFGVNDLNGDEMIVEAAEMLFDVANVLRDSAVATITTKEVTLAKALAELKDSKPKLMLDEELTFKLQAEEEEEEEEERLAKEKA
nr:hypothetical protein [Tanacetum cinerariifolium]